MSVRRLGPVLLVVPFAAACATRRPAPPQSPGPAAPPAESAPAPSAPAWFEEGVASWYGGDDGFEGKPTASGELYDSSRMTAAHRELPLGTIVEVTSLDNGRSVRVRINDRGPFTKGRVIDLSQAAARRLDIVAPGTGRVRLTIVQMGPAPTPPAPRAEWAIQLGSFADPDRAARQAERVRAAGREAYLEPYNGLSRVKVGPFSSREDAQAALAELEAAGFEGIVVAQ